MTDQVIVEPAVVADTSTVAPVATPPIPETPIITNPPVTAPTVEVKVEPKVEVKTETKGSSLLPKDNVNDIALTDEMKSKLAAGDEKVLKELSKYKNLSEVVKSKLELQNQFSKTRPIPQLPKDATKEQIKEYREASGVPETWEKYDLTLDKGLIIGEADKPVVNEYLQKFHEANLPSDTVKKILQINFEHQNKIASEAIKRAEDHEKQTATALREQLGAKYDEKMAMTANYIKTTLGDEVFNKLMGAISPDGTYLIADPKVMNHFLEASKNQYGNPTMAPTKGSEMTGLLGRKAELEKIASSNPKQWYDSPDLREEYNNISLTFASKK